MNPMLDKLKAGKVAVGATASWDNETRFLARSGLDFLLFDTQHSPVEIKRLDQPVGVMRGGSAIPIVRVGDNTAEQICYALDIGAKGVVCPMVNSGAEADQMVKASKYPFDGIRSSAGARGDWGEFASYRDYLDHVNDNVLIIPMVETMEAFGNLTDIVTTPGINALLIGPSDFSINLDVPLDYTNPKYHEAISKVAKTCRDNGVAPGMYFVPPGIETDTLIGMGFQFFTMPWHGWATSGIREGVAKVAGS